MAIFLAILAPCVSNADSLRIATWNIANLHHEDGVPLRDRAIPRDPIDYERISQIIDALDADIVALQEIGSPAALYRIIEKERWHVYFSPRYTEGDENKPSAKRDIFGALIVSKARFPDPPNFRALSALAFEHLDIRDGEAKTSQTRVGLVMEFNTSGADIALLAVHLKSSCHHFSLSPIEDEDFVNGKAYGSRYDCRTLSAQMMILENWIEQQWYLGKTVIVVGDFNRRLNILLNTPRREEHFWAAINDGQPFGHRLVKAPLGKDVVCWPNHEDRYGEHIDFIVYGEEMSTFATEIEIDKVSVGYESEPRYSAGLRQRLSDHCPVIGRFQLR